MKERIATSERLARVLEELEDPKLEGLIQRAREGYYDPLKSPEGAIYSTIRLIRDLTEVDYPDLVERTRDGEWEPRRWEKEEWFRDQGHAMLNREWPDSATGRILFIGDIVRGHRGIGVWRKASDVPGRE